MTKDTIFAYIDSQCVPDPKVVRNMIFKLPYYSARQAVLAEFVVGERRHQEKIKQLMLKLGDYKDLYEDILDNPYTSLQEKPF